MCACIQAIVTNISWSSLSVFSVYSLSVEGEAPFLQLKWKIQASKVVQNLKTLLPSLIIWVLAAELYGRREETSPENCSLFLTRVP